MEFIFSPEVSNAIGQGAPVVALESTVIAHGLPFPENFDTAGECEIAVRSSGAVPATIAVFGGACHVGLDERSLHALATRKDIRKISTRDLAIAHALKLDCATTVATTAFLAERAGIKVFATGGIGGVHRGSDGDISADLPQLAQTPIAVVCSGAKIVLDLERTREWLETYGVPVLGWRCTELPAFYSRESGLPVDETVTTAAEAAAIIRARDDLDLRAAVLITVPVPERLEIGREELEALLEESLALAQAEGVSGKNVTPYLLEQLSRRSQGRTLAANIGLLVNNARVAGQIAAAL